MKRFFSRLTLTACMTAVFASSCFAQSRTVNVYNWNDYIDAKILDDFTKETGIRVIYDTYDNSEIVETKMLSGKSGYDIVVLSATLSQRLVVTGVFMPLDRTKLTNHKNLWPEIMERQRIFDPDNKFTTPYLWGTFGLGVNVAQVKARLGNDFPMSWDLLLDPKISSKLRDCGIHVFDGVEEVLPNVLRTLKLDVISKTAADLQKAGDALFRIRDNVKVFHSSDYINGLASGNVCLAVGFSNDILRSRQRAKESGNNVEIEYLIPREGASMWLDSLAIPSDAPNGENAHVFINYLLRPDVAAANSNLLNNANANIASRDQIKSEILNNPNIYPNAEMMKRLFTSSAFDERSQRTISRLWTRVKTGK